MDRRADALPILFMLAAEAEAADLQFWCGSNEKTHRRMDGGSRVDALGEFRLYPALTKLSQSAQRTRFITGRHIYCDCMLRQRCPNVKQGVPRVRTRVHILEYDSSSKP